MSGESAAERWSPAQRVESVLISILSLLDDPEISSPANVDASVTFRRDPKRYKELVKQDLDRSKQDVPEGYVLPSHDDAFKTKKEDEYMMNWEDSDEDLNEFEEFGGSDSSDVEMTQDEDEDRGPEEQESDSDG